MDARKIPFLSGGVFFFLLTQATMPNASAREHRRKIKDEHSEPILMTDLIYTFTGSQNYGSPTDTTNYKECQMEGGSNVPFNDIAICAAYENLISGKYSEALKRMDEFVSWHFNPEMKEWFVKALLEIIENEEYDDGRGRFYIYPDGTAATRADVRCETQFDLSAFMVGIMHFILTQRREKNRMGLDTLDSISEKKKRKPRRYTGHLGEKITRDIDVAFLPQRTPRMDVDGQMVEGVSDDDIIGESITRSGMAVATAVSSALQPEIDTEGLTKSLATVAARMKSYEPDDLQKENMVKGISAAAAAIEAQKHALAERIIENGKREESASSTEIPFEEQEQAEQGEKKTTIIQQQTNVVQNGENNFNLTNNGTMTFNF